MNFCLCLSVIFLIINVVPFRFSYGSMENLNKDQLYFPDSLPVHSNNNTSLASNFTSQAPSISSTTPSNNNNNFFSSKINNKNQESSSALKPHNLTKDNNNFQTSPSSITSPSSSYSLSLENLLSIKTTSTKTISELKCNKYMKEIASTIHSDHNLKNDSSLSSKICDNSNRLTIRNDTQVHTGEFPHLVALGYMSPEFNLACSGSLISNTWVLTVAHCTNGIKGSLTHAKIGSYNLTDEEGIITIKNIMRHPDYMPPELYADIALVNLTKDVTFNHLVKPACLYQSYHTTPTYGWVSGWGIDLLDENFNEELFKIRMNVIDSMKCATEYNTDRYLPYGIVPSMICALHISSNLTTNNTCQGSSGSPFQRIDSHECLFQVIGITSFSMGCPISEIPIVYTRVSHYLPWIESIVWPQEQIVHPISTKEVIQGL